MKNVKLDHLNLTARNLNEAIQWYTAVFGFHVVERGVRAGTPWAIVRSGDQMLCLSEHGELAYGPEPEGHHRIYHFGLRIESKAQWERLLEERGDLHVHHGPIRYPHSTSWYITDPSGHEIEVALWDAGEVAFG